MNFPDHRIARDADRGGDLAAGHAAADAAPQLLDALGRPRGCRCCTGRSGALARGRDDRGINSGGRGHETASLSCSGRSGPPTGRLSARSGQPRESETSKRKSVRGFKKPIWKDMPQTPVAAGPSKKSAPPSNYAAFHRAASRLKDGKPAVGVDPYAATQSGPLLVAVEREPSPNRSVARFDSPAKS